MNAETRADAKAARKQAKIDKALRKMRAREEKRVTKRAITFTRLKARLEFRCSRRNITCIECCKPLIKIGNRHRAKSLG